MADHLADAGAAVGLRQLNMAGQRIDDLAGEKGAIDGGQRPFVALEVVGEHELAIGVGDDEIDAAALEVASEEQMRVLDDNRVRRRLGRHRLDMRLRLGVVSHAIGRQSAIEFSDEIQRATANGLIFKDYSAS